MLLSAFVKSGVFLSLFMCSVFANAQPGKATPPISCIKLSQNFLYAAKTGDSTKTYIDSLNNTDESALLTELNTDQKRLAFWLNIYNGFTQVFLKKRS